MTTQYPSTVGDPRDTDELRERSLPELLKQLSADTTRLVHQELELAKAELTQKGRRAGAGAGLFGAAGAIGLLGAAALTACFILALDAVMPTWLAALLVAVVYGVIALVVVKQGQAKLKAAGPPVPEQTIETVKETWHGPRPRCDPRRHRPDTGRDERDGGGDRLQGRRALPS